MTQPATPRHAALPEFRADIQGLRAIAVLAVMIFHADKAWLPAGFTGVDMFFVISGFIVSRLILSREGRFDWYGFYMGRLARILPAYLSILLVVASTAAVLLPQKGRRRLFFFQHPRIATTAHSVADGGDTVIEHTQ